MGSLAFWERYSRDPDSLVLKEELKKVNFAALKYNETTLYKPKGMQITLGALAKGYILDQALEFMRSRPLSRGFINSRSSMSFYGYKVAPLVYIQHPAITTIASLVFV